MTREEFAKMLVESADVDVPPSGRRLPFLIEDADHVSQWASPYMDAAIAAGLIEGFEDDTFRPLDNVNRVQVAVMLTRALGLTPEGVPPFLDADDIPDWGAGHVAVLSEFDIIKGIPSQIEEGTVFDSYLTATRAQAAAFLTRYLELRLRR